MSLISVSNQNDRKLDLLVVLLQPSLSEMGLEETVSKENRLIQSLSMETKIEQSLSIISV